MLLVEKKRENNIAEYLIYMYQTEDLLRSFEFDLERINRDLISLLPGSDIEKEELKEWYSNIIYEMEKENIKHAGHLSSVVDVINELKSLFATLVSDDETFRDIAQNAQPLFDKSPSLDNVEVCLNGMYAFLILKTDNIPVPSLTEKSAEIYGEVLSYLSFKYKQMHYLNRN